MKSKLKPILLALFPLAVVAAFLVGILTGGVATKKNKRFDKVAEGLYKKLRGEEEEKEQKEDHLVDVVVAPIVRKPMVRDTDLSGSIVANETVDLSAEMAGRVVSIPLGEGNAVEDTTRPIVAINDDVLQAQLAQARASLDLAQKEYQRYRNLFDQGVAQQRELQSKKAALDNAAAQLELIEANLAKAKIFSPITGVLDRVYVDEGEYVTPGQRVATILQTRPLKVEVQIPENRIPFIRKGLEVTLRHTVLEDVTARGRFTYLGEAATGPAKTYRGEITILDPPAQLKPGMFVRVRAPLRTLPEATPAPIFAVIPAEGRQTVFVEKDGVAWEREVQLGTISGNLVNITRGLNPGDVLVIDGQRQLSERQKVNPFAMTFRLEIEQAGLDAETMRGEVVPYVRAQMAELDGVRRIYDMAEDGRAIVAALFDIDVVDPTPILKSLKARADRLAKSQGVVGATTIVQATPLPLTRPVVELRPTAGMTSEALEALGERLAEALETSGPIEQVGTPDRPVLAIYTAKDQSTDDLAAAVRTTLATVAPQAELSLVIARAPRLTPGTATLGDR